MTPELEEQLIEHLKDAHAIESRIQQLLEQMIAASGEKSRRVLQHHQLETRHRGHRLAERLQAYGESVRSTAKPDPIETGTAARLDARRAFLLARLKVAAYELLEAIGARAGDHATAEVARLNRRNEETLAAMVASAEIGLISHRAAWPEDAGR